MPALPLACAACLALLPGLPTLLGAGARRPAICRQRAEHARTARSTRTTKTRTHRQTLTHTHAHTILCSKALGQARQSGPLREAALPPHPQERVDALPHVLAGASHGRAAAVASTLGDGVALAADGRQEGAQLLGGKRLSTGRSSCSLQRGTRGARQPLPRRAAQLSPVQSGTESFP